MTLAPDAPPAGDAWAGLLEPGERILWQGAPEARVRWEDIEPRRALFGLGITAFALVWMVGAFAAVRSEGPVALALPAVALVFVYQGLKRAGGYLLWDAYERSKTWYTLTDRRAIVAGDALRRRSLRSWPIERDTVLELRDGRDGRPGSVLFARTFGRGKSRQLGFVGIAEAREVYRLMLEAQRRLPAGGEMPR